MAHSPNGNEDLVTVYLENGTAPSRAVWMTCKALDLHVNIKTLNVFSREHTSNDYIKISPLQSVPAIDDHGFVLWESHAIMGYLVDKHGHNDALYPRDTNERAAVNNLLFFNRAPIYYKICQWLYPQVFERQPPDAFVQRELDSSLQAFDNLLRKSTYAAGDHMTIADIALLASITTLEMLHYDMKPFARVEKWLKRLKSQMPYYEECASGFYNWCELFYQKKLTLQSVL